MINLDFNRLLGLPTYSRENFNQILFSNRKGAYTLTPSIYKILKDDSRDIGFFWSTKLLDSYCGEDFFEKVTIQSIKNDYLTEDEMYQSILDHLESIENDCLMEIYLSGNIWPESPEGFNRLSLEGKVNLIGEDLSFYVGNRDIHNLLLYYAKRKEGKKTKYLPINPEEDSL